MIPFNGDPPEPPHPTGLEIAGGRETADGGHGGKFAFESLAIEPSLDYVSERAERGSYFLLLDIRVEGVTDCCPPVLVGTDQIRLEVDGAVRTAHELEGLVNQPSKGEEIDDRIVFVVPQDAGELALIVGNDGETQATYPIEASG